MFDPTLSTRNGLIQSPREIHVQVFSVILGWSCLQTAYSGLIKSSSTTAASELTADDTELKDDDVRGGCA